MLIIFLTSRHQQRICPGKPNSQFFILLWRFTETAWKWAKTSPRTLGTKELAVASRQCTVSHLSFSPRNFYQKIAWLSSPTHPLFCFPDWR
jgi:hypothetical protein